MFDDLIETQLASELERESLFLRDAHSRWDSQLSESAFFGVDITENGEEFFESDLEGASAHFSGIEDVQVLLQKRSLHLT